MNEKIKIEKELTNLKRQSSLRGARSEENESKLTSQINNLEKKLEIQEKIIREETLDHIETKGVNWGKWVKLGIQGTGALGSIAAVVVAAACKVM